MGHLSEILFGNKSFEMTGFPCQNIEPLEWDTPSLAAIQKEASVNGLGHPSRKSQTELAHQMWPTLKKFGPVGPLQKQPFLYNGIVCLHNICTMVRFGFGTLKFYLETNLLKDWISLSEY